MSTAESTSWTIASVLNWSTSYLNEKGSKSARLDAQLLISNALNLTRVQLYTNFDTPLSPEELKGIRELLTRRAAGEPVAYVLGNREFMGHSFKVNPSVLIPRPDTEVLVEKVIDSSDEESSLKILDVGTGSGCIAISLAARLGNSQVSAWDKSPKAIEVASANADSLGIDNVEFFEKDALADETWQDLGFDIVVSNPPYITDAEMLELAVDVREYEPEMALSGGVDGLSFYKFFATKICSTLNDDGRVFWEIGSTQAESVSALLKEAGLVEVSVIQDYAGHDRVVSARKLKAE